MELAAAELTSPIQREKLLHAVTGIAHEVAEQVGSLLEDEPDNEIAAALLAVSDVMTTADLSDDALFADDVDGEVIARRIRATMPEPVGLSSKGSRLYRVALDQSCRYLAQVVLQLPAFEPRALATVLGRLSAVSTQLTELLDRTPRASLRAPQGTNLDLEFTRRYLNLVASAYDSLELIGVSIRNYRPRTTLSVAYLGLTVDSKGTSTPDHVVPFGAKKQQRAVGAIRVEEALAQSSRVLLRGEAGSGKTTLLGWLVVTAARSGFTGDLSKWNGHVPFVVKLRRFAGRRLPEAEEFLQDADLPGLGPVPPGWAHRMLLDHKALLLVDGVDELTPTQRPAVRRWLEKLLDAYPNVPVVVTSRPGAVNAKWLARFTSFSLERMTPDDVRTFLLRWHAALLDAAKDTELLPFSHAEVERHRRELLTQLNTRSDLRALASNPLMCSMLCALHLDRGSNLPKDRAGLYNAAMELLLDRRDADREIPAGSEVRMDYQHKLSLLQAIAWWLTLNGRSEVAKGRAEQLVARQLTDMLTCKETAGSALEYLLARSGVIREPVEGRVDFVHKTFLEFLAGREAVESDHVNLLVERAHTDLWRETVVMAAGLLNRPQRTELITGILDRADRSSSRAARTLRLLATRCRESLRDLPPEVSQRLDECIQSLVPPRNVRESRSLATVGESIIDMLPDDTRSLTLSQAKACVQTATLTNGPAAIKKLANYAVDDRRGVQESLIESWQYFDPEQYAESVLADASLLNGAISLRGMSATDAHIANLSKLRHIRNLQLITDSVIDCNVLRFESPLMGLDITAQEVVDINLLSSMTNLTTMTVRCKEGIRDLEFLPEADLVILTLGDVTAVKNYSALQSFPNIRILSLIGAYHLTDLDTIGTLSQLEQLQLEELAINNLPPHFADQFPQLSLLYLGASELTDLSPLVGTTLADLYIKAPLVRDLAPLASISSLRDLSISSPEVGLDLTPLADSNLQYLTLYGAKDPYGLDSLPESIEVLISPR